MFDFFRFVRSYRNKNSIKGMYNSIAEPFLRFLGSYNLEYRNLIKSRIVKPLCTKEGRNVGFIAFGDTHFLINSRSFPRRSSTQTSDGRKENLQ